MGLFGFIGKVAKAGLSVATHGASDKVLGAIKSINAQKKANAIRTTAAQAMAARYQPQVRITTQSSRSVLEDAVQLEHEPLVVSRTAVGHGRLVADGLCAQRGRRFVRR